MPSQNYISLINPAAFRDFNLTQGQLNGQLINQNTSDLLDSSLARSQVIRDINASLEFENQFRNARAANPRASLNSLLNTASAGSLSPFAALQGFEGAQSVSRALLGQQAAQQNLQLGQSLLGGGGAFGNLNNSLLNNRANQLNGFDLSFNRPEERLGFSTVDPVERTNSRGARAI